MNMTLIIGAALHWLAHKIDRTSPCNCELRAYRKGWQAGRDMQERRARLLREEGVPGGLLDQAKREGLM